MCRVGCGMQVAKTPTYPVTCRFPLFVEPCDHNPPTLQTDAQRNILLVTQARA